MAKNNRGKGLWAMLNRSRGVCPMCGRKAVKLMWEAKKGEDTIKVCKLCRNKTTE